jgi:hypothetical protein
LQPNNDKEKDQLKDEMKRAMNSLKGDVQMVNLI